MDWGLCEEPGITWGDCAAASRNICSYFSAALSQEKSLRTCTSARATAGGADEDTKGEGGGGGGCSLSSARSKIARG